MATRKSQTLAEHSFNVAQIALAILDELNMRDYWGGPVALRALDHDIEEVITGDIPTPEKDPYKDWSGEIDPAKIVKMADVIDAWVFIEENKVDRHGEHVAAYVHSIYNEMLDQLKPKHRVAVGTVVTNILEGKYQ